MNRSGGFTLIETLVGMTISGVAVSAAVTLFVAISDRADAISDAATRVDSAAVAEELLRSVARNLDVPTEGASFTGNRDTLQFGSWCESAAGWLERCSIQLHLSPYGATTGARLLVRGPYQSEMQVRAFPRSAHLVYLGQMDDRRYWIDTWQRLDAPVAFAVVTAFDTLLVPLGGDG